MLDSTIRLCAFALALTPAGLIAFYVWARRSHAIGFEFVVISAGLGACVVLLAAGIEIFVIWAAADLVANVHLASWLQAFAVIALTEETAKLAVLVFVVMRHEDCRTPRDVMCGAILVSIGFAALENIFYVVGENDWQGIGFMRSFTAVPSHAIDGILMGFYAALALKHEGSRSVYLLKGLLIAVLFHGLYDWPLVVAPQLGDQDLFAIFYGAVFVLTLLVSGTIGMRWLDSPRLESQLASARTASRNGPVAPLWQPPPWFWRFSGILLFGLGLLAPVFGYYWQNGGLIEALGMIPLGILPVFFGFSIWRYGRRMVGAVPRASLIG